MQRNINILALAAGLCTVLMVLTWLPLWNHFDATQNFFSMNTVGVLLWPANIVALWVVVYRQNILLKLRQRKHSSL